MKLAETVTFGGSALDRAAELRGSAQGQPQAGLDPQVHALNPPFYSLCPNPQPPEN